MTAPDHVGYVLREMAAGSMGIATTSALLNSLDVVKVRIQLPGIRYSGMIDCARQSVKEGGGVVRGLMIPGLTATILRDILNGGFRVGLFKEVERSLFPEGSVTPVLLQKVVTGTLVGATGAGLWSHTDLVKTRMQVQPAEFSSTWNAYGIIYRREGFRGLYRGVGPNMFRASLITTCHVGSYDMSKKMFKGFLDEESVLAWTVSGFFSALVTTTVSAPVDLIRTRVMMSSCPSSRWYVYFKVGPRGLFSGWLASFCRFGPHFTLSWPLIEFFRKHIFGLDSF